MALWLCSLRTCTPRPCCTRPAWRPLWRPSTDLIVCTGDLVDGTTTNRDADVAPLGLLRARYGVYACEGNHEYYADYAGWMRHFAALGLPLLHNAHTVVDIGGTPLVIAGLNDPMAPLFGRPGPDLEKALAGAPAGAATLLLAHQPVGARENAAHGIDLQISGHTHGGQMLGFDQIVAARNDGFVRGLYDVDAMRLFVGPGVGLWAGFPVRLGVPAGLCCARPAPPKTGGQKRRSRTRDTSACAVPPLTGRFARRTMAKTSPWRAAVFSAPGEHNKEAHHERIPQGPPPALDPGAPHPGPRNSAPPERRPDHALFCGGNRRRGPA